MLLFFVSQVLPGVVRPEPIIVTVSAIGVSPPYSQTFAIEGDTVEIFTLPSNVMAVGSEQASKGIRVNSTGMIGKTLIIIHNIQIP